MTDTTEAVPNPILQGLRRGVRRQCPNCAAGPLFAGYVKVLSPCPNCSHDNAQYKADDAGPYFTILLVGHLCIGPLLIFPFIWKSPLWLVLGTTLPLIMILTLLLLPVVKGAVIGVQWGMKTSREAKTSSPPLTDGRS